MLMKRCTLQRLSKAFKPFLQPNLVSQEAMMHYASPRSGARDILKEIVDIGSLRVALVQAMEHMSQFDFGITSKPDGYAGKAFQHLMCWQFADTTTRFHMHWSALKEHFQIARLLRGVKLRS